jgi:pyruvyltransferase
MRAPTPSAEDSAGQFPYVELFYWRPRDGRQNFGDHLSPVIVGKLLADANHVIEEGRATKRRLLGVGSILHFARDGDTVWGSGVNGKIPGLEHRYSQLDVRAVRGPLTRDFLLERGIPAPEVYGDPALLLPTLFPGRFRPRPQRDHVFVPNLHDATAVDGWANVVSPLLPWNVCVDRILEGALVLASSLHGLIIAEAYGVPARYVRLSDTEHLFKYEDYVRGTGRPGLEFARSRDEAIEMGGMPAPQFDASKLVAAFPYDLWDDAEQPLQTESSVQ